MPLYPLLDMHMKDITLTIGCFWEFLFGGRRWGGDGMGGRIDGEEESQNESDDSGRSLEEMTSKCKHKLNILV